MVVAGGYCSLLVVTVSYRSLPLVNAHSVLLYLRGSVFGTVQEVVNSCLDSRSDCNFSNLRNSVLTSLLNKVSRCLSALRVPEC